jgi:hypothetical protein
MTPNYVSGFAALAGATPKLRRLEEPIRAAGPPRGFGLRLWASVCLALFVAFWLDLDNPFWAGASAAIVCQRERKDPGRSGGHREIGC